MATIPTPDRLTPDVTTMLVVNKSSRGGVQPDTIVVHTTEGGSWPFSWFNNPASQASSHVAVSNGRSQRYVRDAEKAWTQGNWNPRCLSIEIVGFASTPRWKWLTDEEATLKETARWIAHWSITEDIHPINVRSAPGVCGHVDISGPGGHTDPGPGFPWDVVLDLAYRIKKARLA